MPEVGGETRGLTEQQLTGVRLGANGVVEVQTKEKNVGHHGDVDGQRNERLVSLLRLLGLDNKTSALEAADL